MAFGLLGLTSHAPAIGSAGNTQAIAKNTPIKAHSFVTFIGVVIPVTLVSSDMVSAGVRRPGETTPARQPVCANWDKRR
ncbi:MAG: hypothetical protein BroJett033_8910 [Chloroflexota bacterium]|nr:MAG: hypothetical protein BroJett033_8910 [Chloroflexota bacterium]